MSARPLSMQIIDAVLAPSCPLRLEVRALVVVMAFYADRNTGIGMRSQATIAAHLRTTDRTVRRLEAEVAETPGSPVAIVRRARQRKDGRGRTSDAYQIILTEAGLTGTHVPDGDEDQPEHPVRVEAPSGHPGPVGEGDQTDATVRLDEPGESRPTGHPMHDQPDKIARPTGHQCPTIQSVDPVCDPVCISAPQADAGKGPSAEPLKLEATSPKPKAQKAPPGTKAKRPSKDDAAPDPRVKVLWDHYHAEHKRLRQVEPVFTERQRGRVGKTWKDFLSVLSLEEAKAAVTTALADPFVKRAQPWDLLGRLNDIRGQGPIAGSGAARPGTGRGPAQPNQTEKPSWLKSTWPRPPSTQRSPSGKRRSSSSWSAYARSADGPRKSNWINSRELTCAQC